MNLLSVCELKLSEGYDWLNVVEYHNGGFACHHYAFNYLEKFAQTVFDDKQFIHNLSNVKHIYVSDYLFDEVKAFESNYDLSCLSQDSLIWLLHNKFLNMTLEVKSHLKQTSSSKLKIALDIDVFKVENRLCLKLDKRIRPFSEWMLKNNLVLEPSVVDVDDLLVLSLSDSRLPFSDDVIQFNDKLVLEKNSFHGDGNGLFSVFDLQRKNIYTGLSFVHHKSKFWFEDESSSIKNQVLFLIKPQNNQLIGHLSYQQNGNLFKIGNISIHHQYRNQGLTSRLYETLLKMVHKYDGLLFNNDINYTNDGRKYLYNKIKKISQKNNIQHTYFMAYQTIQSQLHEEWLNQIYLLIDENNVNANINKKQILQTFEQLKQINKMNNITEDEYEYLKKIMKMKWEDIKQVQNTIQQFYEIKMKKAKTLSNNFMKLK